MATARDQAREQFLAGHQSFATPVGEEEEDDPLAELAAELESDDEPTPRKKKQFTKSRHYGVVFGEGKGVGNSRTEQVKKLAEASGGVMKLIEITPHLPTVAKRRADARKMLGQSGVHFDDFMYALNSQFATLEEETVAIFEGYPTSDDQVKALIAEHGLPRFVIFLYDGQNELAKSKDAAAVVASIGAERVLVVDATKSREKVHKQLRKVFFEGQTLLARPMQDTTEIEYVSEMARKSSTPISVLQWNVLADGLCANSPENGGFGLCPTPWLKADYRRSAIVKAIGARSPDVVALQETDNWDWWKLEMGKLGYEGRERMDDKSPCLEVALNQPKYPDGLAIFWKPGRFRLSDVVLGKDPQDISAEGKDKFLIARLRVKKTGEYVVVCNTHLDSRKSVEGSKVRLKQTQRLLTQLEEMALPTAWDTTGKDASAVFLCGDLNEVQGQNSHREIKERKILKETYRTQAGMRDVMRDQGGHTYAGYITSYKCRTGDYKHGTHKYAVDHMFHCGSAVPMTVARMPTAEEIGPRGLPSLNWPSDHMYIYTEYLLCATRATEKHRLVQNPMAGSGGELDDMRRSLVGGQVGGKTGTQQGPTKAQKTMLGGACMALVVLSLSIGFVALLFW